MKSDRKRLFAHVSGPQDASEDEVALAISTIHILLENLRKNGFGPDRRASDPGVERSLRFIRDACTLALVHVHLIDHPDAAGGGNEHGTIQ